jgi:protein-S-isoprenylcysteine O-methyltransferase Ste14
MNAAADREPGFGRLSVEARATLHVVGFFAVVFVGLPSLLAALFGGTSWLAADRSWRSTFGLQLAAVLGLSGVQEFARRGRGTQFPYDPPRRLVVTGPYAYVANPMQICKVLSLLFGAVFLGNGWLGAVGLVYLAVTALFTGPREDAELERRFGGEFRLYRSEVKRWLPRWTPRVDRPARLYVAEDCGRCRTLGDWIRALRPVLLEVVPADSHPLALTRLTYASAGIEESGVAALARALEHVHLGWAFLGFLVRLPGVHTIAQLVADAMGGDRIRACPASTSARRTSS